LAATDPAQPYGAALPWPATDGRPARAAGAHVVLIDGELAAFLERGGHSLSTFGVDGWAVALPELVARGRYRSLEIRKVDGQPVREVEVAVQQLRDAGFVDGYKGLVYRAPR
jgi:ATP-dependent Lhr-like helicase